MRRWPGRLVSGLAPASIRGSRKRPLARVAELADAQDSGSCPGNWVEVQVLSRAFPGFFLPWDLFPRRPFWRAGVGPEASPAGGRPRGTAGRGRSSDACRFDSPSRRPGPRASSPGRPGENPVAAYLARSVGELLDRSAKEFSRGRGAGDGEARRALSAGGVTIPLPHRKSRFAGVAVIRRGRVSRPPCRRRRARSRRRLQQRSRGTPELGIPCEMTPRDASSQENSMPGVDISNCLSIKT